MSSPRHDYGHSPSQRASEPQKKLEKATSAMSEHKNADKKQTTLKELTDANKGAEVARVVSPKTLNPEGRYLEQSPHKHRSNSKEVSQRVSKWNPVADGPWNSLPVQYRERQVTRGDRGTQTTGWSGRIAGGKHGSAGGCDYADEHGHRFDIDQHEVLAGVGAWAK